MGAAIVKDFVSMLKLVVSAAWALRDKYTSIYRHRPRRAFGHCVVWSLRMLESPGPANIQYAIILYTIFSKLLFWKSDLEHFTLKLSSWNSHLQNLILKVSSWTFHFETLLAKLSSCNSNFEHLLFNSLLWNVTYARALPNELLAMPSKVKRIEASSVIAVEYRRK